MARVVFLVSACFSFFPSSASAQQVDPVKLRQAVKWPAHGAEFRVVADGNLVFKLFRPQSPPAQENWEEAVKEFRNEPERLYLIALDWQATHPEQAREILLRAKSLLEARLKESPKEGWWSALYGLVGSELKEENHAVWIEKSVKLSPTDARCWNALGNFRCEAEMARLLKGFAVQQLASADEDDRTMALQRVFAQTWTGLEESRQCHDRAVELDPKNPLYVRDRFQQASFRCLHGVFLTCMRQFAPDDLAAEIKHLLQDMQSLTRFCPDEENLWALQAVFRLMFPVGDQDNKTAKDDAKARVQERLLLVREECAALSRLAKQTNPIRGAKAAYFLASLQTTCGDLAKAENSLDLALERNADYQKASELKEQLLLEREEIDQARCLSLRRLEKSPSARNYFHFAYNHTETDEEAEPVIREGLKREPRHLPSLLAMAAIHLRKSAHPISLDQASGYLQKAEDVLKTWREASSQEQAELEPVIDKEYAEYSIQVYRAVIAAQRGETLMPWIALRDLQRADPKDEQLTGLLAAFE